MAGVGYVWSHRWSEEARLVMVFALACICSLFFDKTHLRDVENEEDGTWVAYEY